MRRSPRPSISLSRRLLSSGLGLILLCGTISLPAREAAETPVAIGITAVFLDDQLSLLKDWENYLSARTGRQVRFVQRRNYREIMSLLHEGKLDFAWICGYPYVAAPERPRLLAVPVYQGRPEYRSYLIVPAEDRATRGLADLAGKVFAFSDPDSNSGYLVTRYQLQMMGARPEEHFRKSFFTGAHRKVVEAVAAGLARGGAVDGYIWETLARIEPSLTAMTRVVEKSRPFGFPPLVAARQVKAQELSRMRKVLLAMEGDPEGRRLLSRMNLDGFTEGSPRLYAEIERMKRAIGADR